MKKTMGCPWKELAAPPPVENKIISNTKPIPMENQDLVLAHALAGQFLGKSFIFLENGSGAKKHTAENLIKYLKPMT